MTLWQFQPAPKVAPAGRTLAPGQTETRLRHVLPRIPVTRVADVTPLDHIGIPVFSACTPLAADLAVHMGKGADSAAARVSALMEAVERASAEDVNEERVVCASFTDLGADPDNAATDPQQFTLPPSTSYRPNRKIRWVDGHDLLGDRPVLLARDLAVNPPADGVLVDVDTNGLAAGNIHIEAIVHAICEVVERDAVSQLEFCSTFGDGDDPRIPMRMIDLATLPALAGALVERMLAVGQHVVLHDITGDLWVPTFAAWVLDPAYPGALGTAPMVFAGFGAHPDASVALLRAVTEAHQSRMARIQGARDSYNTSRARARVATLLECVRRFAPLSAVPFGDLPSAPADDVLDDLAFLLARLRATGFEQCIAVDLTRVDLGVPVVRVRVPGLSQFCVDNRRVDARCWRWLL